MTLGDLSPGSGKLAKPPGLPVLDLLDQEHSPTRAEYASSFNDNNSRHALHEICLSRMCWLQLTLEPCVLS